MTEGYEREAFDRLSILRSWFMCPLGVGLGCVPLMGGVWVHSAGRRGCGMWR